jgi:hypothetical protein
MKLYDALTRLVADGREVTVRRHPHRAGLEVVVFDPADGSCETFMFTAATLHAYRAGPEALIGFTLDRCNRALCHVKQSTEAVAAQRNGDSEYGR